MMDLFANMEWHYDVHQRLGEKLVYYLLRIRPFDAKDVKDKLRSLLTTQHLESVRIFKVFGSNDLLIRAWLHAQVSPEFPEYLKKALPQEISISTFTVRDAHAIASEPPHIEVADAAHLLEILHDDAMLRAVQMGKDNKLLDRLIKAKVVFTRDQLGAVPIKFYIAVHLADEADRIHADAARKIYAHIRERMRNIQRISVFRGEGFCDILIKGEVVGASFFSIGELVDWIYENLSVFKASTETYVVAWPIPVVETPDKISESTFRAIAGKDLFVNIVLPAAYEEYFGKHKIIESLFSRADKQTILRHRQLVREYLLGYLEEKNADMGRVLFVFFSEIEEYLRDTHKEFIGKNSLNPALVYDAVNIPADSRKNITLGHLFNIFSMVIDEKNLATANELSGNWNRLVELRNKQMHGNLNHQEEWSRSLETVLESLPRIYELLDIIFKFTGHAYQFTYLTVNS
jgi:hypothetical protein